MSPGSNARSRKIAHPPKSRHSLLSLRSRRTKCQNNCEAGYCCGDALCQVVFVCIFTKRQGCASAGRLFVDMRVVGEQRLPHNSNRTFNAFSIYWALPRYGRSSTTTSTCVRSRRTCDVGDAGIRTPPGGFEKSHQAQKQMGPTYATYSIPYDDSRSRNVHQSPPRRATYI